MEVDEKPTEQYSDVGGLDKQIQELIEAIVLPMTHKDRFDAIGIKPPKGCLMYGPPGTGKTLLARACAAQTKGTKRRFFASKLYYSDFFETCRPSASPDVYRWWCQASSWCLQVSFSSKISKFKFFKVWQKKKRQLLFSSMSWMPLEQSVSTRRRLAIARSSVLCWSCSINLMVLSQIPISKVTFFELLSQWDLFRFSRKSKSNVFRYF